MSDRCQLKKQMSVLSLPEVYQRWHVSKWCVKFNTYPPIHLNSSSLRRTEIFTEASLSNSVDPDQTAPIE